MVRCSNVSTESWLRAERIKRNSAISCCVMYSSRHVPLLSVNSLDSHVFPSSLPPSNNTQHRRRVCSFISGLQSAQVKEATSTHGVINRNSGGRAFFFFLYWRFKVIKARGSHGFECKHKSIVLAPAVWSAEMTAHTYRHWNFFFPPTKRIRPRNERQMSINGMSLEIKSCSRNSCRRQSEVCYKNCKVYFYSYKLSLTCKHENFISICS